MKENREERIASIVLILFSAAYLTGAFVVPKPALKQQLGPGAFPITVGFAMLILACVYAWQQFRGKATAKETEEEIQKRATIIGAEEKIEKGRISRRWASFWALMLLYAFFFEILGYAINDVLDIHRWVVY